MRSNEAKIRLYRSVFRGLEHVYGTYDPWTGRAWQVKRPVTDRIVLRHLLGRKPYGVYLLTGDRTAAAVADFDQEDITPAQEMVAASQRHGLPVYVERSKSKGYHVWAFFEPGGVSARRARLAMRSLLGRIGRPHVEVFPKHDQLRDSPNQFGNFINAPLFGRLVPQGRTVFLNPAAGMKPFPDQWAFLEDIQRIAEPALDSVVGTDLVHDQGGSVSLGVFRAAQSMTGLALPGCAQRMLEEGVSEYQRVACFRLAVQLRRAGLPFDITVAALSEWRKRNRPHQDRRILTAREVLAQVSAAYIKEYRGHGCEDPAVAPFCDTACPVKRSAQSNRQLK
jgi:TOTE conflict system, Archaeo-Eukaryotic Primase domain